jgi:hypothetical protein
MGWEDAMVPVGSRNEIRSKRPGPLLAMLVVLLGSVLANLAWVNAEASPGTSKVALAEATGLPPAGTDFATIEIKARDASTDALVKGACFYANATSKLFGTYGCDAWDGTLDGVTLLYVNATGTYEVGVKNPPPNRYYLRPYPSVSVTLGTTKHLAFRFGPAVASDLLVTSDRADGSPVLDACVAVFEDKGGGVPGRQVSATICDSFNGLHAANDGVLRLSGIGSGTTSRFVAVPYAPSGYAAARPKTFTQQLGANNRLTFQFALGNYSPACMSSRTSGRVGTTVNLSCGGFAAYQSIGLYWDGKLVTGSERFSSDTGKVSFRFTIPARPAGVHRLQAKSATHAAPRNLFTIVSSLSVSPDSGIGGSSTRATLRGFGKGEVVNIRIQGQRQIRATVTMSSTGSGSASFSIPNGAAANLFVVAEGSLGNVAKDGFARTGPAAAALPTSTEPATATQPPTATATVQPSETPEATATLSAPTAEATPASATPEASDVTTAVENPGDVDVPEASPTEAVAGR